MILYKDLIKLFDYDVDCKVVKLDDSGNFVSTLPSKDAKVESIFVEDGKIVLVVK